MSNINSQENSVFSRLSVVDCAEYVERKGNLSYISWATAWRLVKNLFPAATYTIYETSGGWNYHTDGRTCWVKVGVTIEGLEHIEYLPIMDQRNQSIPLENVTSFDVNKSIQRAITKACARHGLGLSLYAGEDLPETMEKPREKRQVVQTRRELPPPPAEQDYIPSWRQSRSQYSAGRNNQTL